MGVYTWHAAKLRLTGILFPIGFVAVRHEVADVAVLRS